MCVFYFIIYSMKFYTCMLAETKICSMFNVKCSMFNVLFECYLLIGECYN